MPDWRKSVFPSIMPMPRGTIVKAREVYRRVRHAVGEVLVRRSPALYRAFGGRAPALRPSRAALEGLARADA